MKISAANSVVRSASRDVICRPAKIAEVGCHCGNYYVMDSCPQQVIYCVLIRAIYEFKERVSFLQRNAFVSH